jgi:LDH2 family malate/lactate/ureidoglycolate dehydrogenase
MTFAEFTKRVDTLIDDVRSSGPPDGPVPHIPGERGFRLAAERLRDGVPLDPAEVARLDSIRSQLGISAW